MELINTYTCPCRPNFTYASNQALYQHKKSQRHKAWEERIKSEKIDATKKDNELFTLRLKLSDREEKIRELENERICLNVKINKLTDDNRTLRKAVKKFTNPKTPEANLIDF